MSAESNLQTRIINLLKKDNSIWYLNVHGGGRFQKSGIPDLIICHNGKFLGLELKAPKGKASPLQKAVGKLIIRAGGGWLCSQDYAEIKEWLYDNVK